MTGHITHTPLSGAATEDITSGLLLGFPDVAGVAQPNPSPLLLSFFMFTVCFSFLSVLPFFLAMKRFYLLHNVVDSKDSVQISVFAHLPPRGLII
jgi:hypothetical protein